MKRFTLRGSTIISVVLIGFSFILLSSLAGNFFRQAALQAQITSLSRIIEVASQEVLRDLQRHALNLGASINTGNHLSHSLTNGSPEEIITLLDDPFITGFVGAPDVELMKIRVYDLELNPLHQSSRGDKGLTFQMPAHLHAIAAKRRGAERLKAVGGLWVSAKGPRYSVLLPVGGLRILGYVEAVFDPLFSLESVSEMTSMPVTILLHGESHTPPQHNKQQEVVLPIEYTLHSGDGEIAYHMIGLENIDKFNQDMLQTQWGIVIGFLTLIFCILLAALWLLRIGLFHPLHRLMLGIEAYSKGQLDTTIKPGGFSEIYTLGRTFNGMIKRIRDDMHELERYSTIDGLTGIPNRRFFDSRMEQELSHARRQGSHLSLLYIDIDFFKAYNDHYGHLGGDEALKKIAQAIASMARRDTDVAARVGGEEFAILLPDTSVQNARLTAENLLRAVAQLKITHEKSKVADHITLSIGIASIIPQIDTTDNIIIEMADKALYRAKSEGRNRVITAE